MSDECFDLDTTDIPPSQLQKARSWWSRRMEETARAHGRSWPEHRAWVADYMNAELRDHFRGRS